MALDAETLNKTEFFKRTWEFEDKCEAETDKAIPAMGVKAPQALSTMGRLLAYLDAIASCAWGCPGGDHAIERLIFRACNRARGAVRLLRLGFYDESLMLSRANGEAANLLWLFLKDKTAIADWKAGARRTSSPVEVRKALEKFSDPMLPPVDQERYKLLSGIGAHSDAGFAPAAHNILDIPVSPGEPLEQGIVLCLNEVAHPLSFIAIAALVLVKLPDDIKKAAKQAIVDQFLAVGSFDIKSRADYLAKQREALAKALEESEDTEGT